LRSGEIGKRNRLLDE